jgi:hypothetical protein
MTMMQMWAKESKDGGEYTVVGSVRQTKGTPSGLSHFDLSDRIVRSKTMMAKQHQPAQLHLA